MTEEQLHYSQCFNVQCFSILSILCICIYGRPLKYIKKWLVFQYGWYANDSVHALAHKDYDFHNNSSIRTHHKKKVPWLGNAILPWKDSFYVPGHKAIQESINYKHSHHIAKGECILKAGWCPNVIPVNTIFWNKRRYIP